MKSYLNGSMKSLLMTLIFLLFMTQRVVINLLPVEYQWLYWNILILFSLVVISFLLMLEISYRKIYHKFLAFMTFNILLYGFIDFIIRTFIEKVGDIKFHIINYVIVFLNISLLLIFIRSFIKYFHDKGDSYDKYNCYLVYRYPKSIWGIVSVIFTAPFGHCFLVVKNRRFSYKRGSVIETKFDPYKQNFVYKKINDVTLEKARKIIGVRWSIINNCFLTFSKFK